VPDEAIERDAQALLAEYAHARGVTIEAPIAIDDIIEKHLKIGIEFDDTHRLFGVPRSGIGFDPDILGAIFFEQKRIVIDESLDPDANSTKEGRYRYTAAHEVGHRRQHRGLFGKDPAQTSKTPLGYKNITGADGKKIIAVEPKLAPIVARLFEWYARGDLSLKEAARKAHVAGPTYLEERRQGAGEHGSHHPAQPALYGLVRMERQAH
jgi:hypothetical protein